MMVTAQQASITLSLLAGRLAAPLGSSCSNAADNRLQTSTPLMPTDTDLHARGFFIFLSLGAGGSLKKKKKIHYDAVLIFRVLLH